MGVVRIDNDAKEITLALEDPALFENLPTPSADVHASPASDDEHAAACLDEGGEDSSRDRDHFDRHRHGSEFSETGTFMDHEKTLVEHLVLGDETDGTIVQLVKQGALVDVGVDRPGLLKFS